MQERREVVFGLGILVCVGLRQAFPFADGAATVDGMLLMWVAVVTIGAIVYARMYGRTTTHFDIAHVPMAAAGVSILLAVVVRQWWQFTASDTQLFNDFSFDITNLLMRYGIIIVTAWVIGWCYLIVAVWPTVDIVAWYATYKHEVWGVGGLVVGASILRWWQLGAIPNIINGDEGLIGMWAVQLLTQPGTLGHVFVNMDGVGTNYLLVMKGVIAVFGRTEYAVRFIPAVFGVIAVVTNYLFARSLFGVRIGFVTAALVASAHVHIHFSRTVAVSYTYATALVPLLLWGIWMLVHTRRSWAAVVAALALSLHVNMYVDAWAWSVLVILVLLAWGIVDWRTLTQHIQQLVHMLVLMLVGIAPMLVWGIYFPADFFARLSTDGSFVSGWLMREANNRQMEPFWIIVELYQYAFATFFTTPFEDFYHASVPILDWMSACFFVIGLIIVHNRLHTWRMLLVLGWFWGGMTALAVFTIPVSTYAYRLFVILPVVLLIVAVGIDWVAELLRQPRATTSSIVVVVVLIAFTNIRIYQTQLADVCRYGGDMKTEQAGTLARVVSQSQYDGAHVFILGNPPDGFYAGPWRSLEYLNPTVKFHPSEDLPTVASEASLQTLWLVAVPERLIELERYQVQYAQNEVITPLQQCGNDVLYMLKIP